MRRRGGPLVLSFLSGIDYESLSGLEFRIVSSSFLSEMEKQEAVRVLIRDTNFSLFRWLQDKRYIPRLLISAAVFIILYLFFSVVVRDPFPILDELVFSFIGAAALWIILSRMDEKSSFMKEKLESIEFAIDEAAFLTSSDMERVEAYYDSLYSYGLAEIAELIARRGLSQLYDVDKEFRKTFSSCLLSHMEIADKGIHKTIKRIKEDRNIEKTMRFLVHQVTIGSLDILDLSLYLALTSDD